MLDSPPPPFRHWIYEDKVSGSLLSHGAPIPVSAHLKSLGVKVRLWGLR